MSKIVYAKIDYLLANGIEITNRFDLANATADPEYTKYVYDPTAITTTNDCLNKTHHKCVEAWVTSRPADIAFSARKLLRLAFHDCIPYKNGNHGKACDGCLNFDANLHDNNGLQYTVAVLEKVWLEPNFPENTPVLAKSLKSMRISRADLWAFASLVGLNDYFLKTRTFCEDTLEGLKATCGDFPCYQPPLENVLNMFQTGRKNCRYWKREAGEFRG